MNSYGKELILDLVECDPGTFTRPQIERFFIELCEEIHMERHDLFWWDDEGLPPEECQTEPHLKGISAVQFIMTSSITIHTLEILRTVMLNVFSCKDFDEDLVAVFARDWFSGQVGRCTVVMRG